MSSVLLLRLDQLDRVFACASLRTTWVRAAVARDERGTPSLTRTYPRSCCSEMAAAASKNEEKDVVGDQRNWEQRVTSELEVAKAWCDSWGPLYEGATTQQQQLKSLEEKLKR